MVCLEQRNPVEYRGRKIRFPEELLDIYFMTYHVSLGENDIDGYMAHATNYDSGRDSIIENLTTEELQTILADEIRDELIKVHQGFIEQLKKEK